MDLADFLDEHDVPHRGPGHEHVRHGWIGVDCPWCDAGGGRFHLGINVQDGYTTCWQCGHHGLADVLEALTGLPGGRIRALLRGLVKPRPPAERRRTGCLRLPAGLSGLAPAHERYLRARGLDPEAIARLWGVRGIGLHPRLAWRLFIPIHLRGKVVSWTTRSIGRGPRRYLSAGPDE